MKRSTTYVLLAYVVLALAFFIGWGLFQITHANPDENQPVRVPHPATMQTPMWWWGSPSGRAWIAAWPIIQMHAGREEAE
jgi:hypothetical protein